MPRRGEDHGSVYLVILHRLAELCDDLQVLRRAESGHALVRDGMVAATEELVRILTEAKISYDEFVLSL